MFFFSKKVYNQTINRQTVHPYYTPRQSFKNQCNFNTNNNIDLSHLIYRSGKPAALKNEAVPVAVPVMPPLSNSFARSQHSPFATTPTVADNFECSSNVSGMFEIIQKIETFSFFCPLKC